jgi:hypothetical protein
MGRKRVNVQNMGTSKLSFGGEGQIQWPVSLNFVKIHILKSIYTLSHYIYHEGAYPIA